MPRRSVGLALVLMATVLVAPPAHAATTRFVDDLTFPACDDATSDSTVTPYCTFQAAIDDSVDGDTISLAAGTYTGLTTTVGFIDNVDLAIVGAGQSLTFISGEDTRRGLLVTSTSIVSVSDLTITDGFRNDSGGAVTLGGSATLHLTDVTVQDSVATFDGGAIYVQGGTAELTLLRVEITDNTGGNGGGVYLGAGATMTVNESTFALNDASADGGGIAGESTAELTVAGSLFDTNTAIVLGGGISMKGSAGITDSHFTGNSASNGGGMYSQTGFVTIAYSLFDGNTAASNGGGMFHEYTESSTDLLRVFNTTFFDNEATLGDGGGAVADGFFINTTFSGNSAGGHGGGLARNTFSTVNAANSIFSGNTAGDTGTDCYGVWSEGYNLVRSDPGYPNGFCISSVSDLTGNVIGVDPALSPLAPNGGPTMTMALAADSPARDAGNPDASDATDWDTDLDEASGDWSCAADDQRLKLRGDVRCDIGAFEVPAVIRYAGANRYATAVAVSEGEHPDGAPHAFVATGFNFPDALAGAAAAGRFERPLLLLDTGIPGSTAAELTRLDPFLITILGGTGAISGATETALGAYADTTERVSSSNRYLTAVEISKAAFLADGSADVVYVATGLGFADALAAGPAAASLNGPVLLVDGVSLLQAVADEIVRLTPDRIIVVGGTSAVSDGVLTSLDALQGGDTVERISGPNRYATAVAISEDAFPDGAPRVYIATGLNFPDALAGAAAAGMHDSPVLLVPGSSLPAVVSAEITRLGANTIYILGGTAVVTTTVENDLKTLIGAS